MARGQPKPTDDAALTSRWISEIEASEKWQRQYWERCRNIIRRYRQERREAAGQPNEDERRYAVLWSNVQTLGPAVYAKTPEAVVGRRYKDSDPVGRYASEVLERSINFTTDEDGFADRMKLIRDDYLLIGRGSAWLRFVPHVADNQEPQVTGQADDEGAEDTKQVYAEIEFEHVAYNDFGFTPCREWSEVWYVFRRVFMGRKDLVARFKEVGSTVPLDWSPKDDPSTDEETKEKTKKAAIYEVWDKSTGKIFWFSKSHPIAPLDQKDDWMGLEGFFPCPRPVMATTPQDKFIPVPDYVYYQDQAEEIDELTAKIGRMIDALKVSGFYAGERNIELQNLFSSKTNQLVPVDSMASLQESGGMKGIIEWFPLDMVILALKTSFETRKEVLEDVYQITGISDIIRGATDPNETATAQGIKSQWGSLRVRDKQQELARFARDVMRIMAEIVAKNFDAKTLAAITDVQLPTQQQQQAAQIIQQAAQQGQQIPPPPGMPTPDVLQRPTWEAVMGLLKSDSMRSFRIDVETDSTVQPDENEEKARRVEFITALAQLMGAALPVLQSAPQMAPLIGKSVEFLARGFRVGREMEDIIEQTFEKIAQMPPQQPPGAQAGPSQAELQLKQQELGIKQQQLHADVQDTQTQAQIDAQRTAMEGQFHAHQLQLEAASLQQADRHHAIDTAAQVHVAHIQPIPPLKNALGA